MWIRQAVAKFIPANVPARIVMGVMDFVRLPVSARKRENHYQDNKTEWERLDISGYLERQEDLAALQYGNQSADYNSCEIVAVYNALLALGRQSDFAGLIESFESLRPCLGGAWGSSPYAMVRYLTTHQYRIRVLVGSRLNSRECTDLSGKDKNAYLATIYNDREDIFAMIHTVCITREVNGYVVHNAGIENKYFESLWEALHGVNEGRAKPLIVIGIS